MLIQDRALMGEVFGRSTSEVPDSGMLRYDTQRQPLAAATEYERRMRLLDRLGFAAGVGELIVAPSEIRDRLSPEQPDDLARLVESVDALGGRVERDAVHGMLLLMPARADAEI